DTSAELCDQILQALSERSHLNVCGASSKPWRQADPDLQMLSVAGHRGVVRHDPTELVVTVRAGTPLAELDQSLAERGQMLAAECPDFPGGSTIGGALALGWSGSRQPYAGALRDFVLGARMVNGLGEALRFGGQVMKNVAGYDIPRLLSGSQGRLGVILEVSLKLLPLPERELTLLFEFESLAQSRQFVRRLLLAGEPITAASYHAEALRLRFSGQATTIRRLATDLNGREVDNEYWRELRRLKLPFFTQEEQYEPLYDWNGDLCWSRPPGGSVQRQVGAASAVDCQAGPPVPGEGDGPLAELQRRLALAFDPAQVFQAVPVEAN
ncbi:MAG: FAD-binding protein, partial [Gammaproteobacteria bacterium]|nr:FAD-binding protein [Gammaproteobacteria bacterium]